jgi:hypothetical protein
MRKSLWIILIALFVAIGAPNAHADGTTYAISFTGTDAPTVVGSDLLFFDSTLDEFTTPTLEIDYFGSDITLDATLLGPTDPLTHTYVWGADMFAFEASDLPAGLNLYIASAITGCQSLENFGCEGGVVLTAQTPPQMPEPASYGLLFLGIGLVLAMRKRIARALPRAS